MELETVLLGCTCHDADRELKSLTLVDAHDPDDVRVLVEYVGLPVIHFPVVDLIDIAHEIEEPAKAHGIEGGRLGQKELKIRRSLLSAGQRPAVLLVPCLRDKFREELSDPQIAHFFSPCAQKGEKSTAFFSQKAEAVLRVLRSFEIHCREEVRVSPFSGQADLRDLLFAEISPVSPKNAVEGNILPGIIQHAHHIQHTLNLRRRKIPGLGLDVIGNALPLEDVPELFIPSGAAPQKNDDIAVSARTHFIVIRSHGEVPDQLFDLRCDGQRLLLPVAELRDLFRDFIFLIFFGTGDQEQFCLVSLRVRAVRVARTGLE